MPIEIKELHIRVAVNAPPGEPPPGARTAAGGPGPEADEARKAIVAECVEQVLRILREKMER